MNNEPSSMSLCDKPKDTKDMNRVQISANSEKKAIEIKTSKEIRVALGVPFDNSEKWDDKLWVSFEDYVKTLSETQKSGEEKIKIEKNLQLEQFYRNEKLQKENTELKEKIRKMEELKKMNVFEYIHSKDKIKRRKSYFQKLL